MSSKNNKKKKPSKKQMDREMKEMMQQPWISMRTAIIVITITSLFMAVLTFIQSYQVVGIGESLLWALLSGGMIWVIFWGFYFVRRKMR